MELLLLGECYFINFLSIRKISDVIKCNKLVKKKYTYILDIYAKNYGLFNHIDYLHLMIKDREYFLDIKFTNCFNNKHLCLQFVDKSRYNYLKKVSYYALQKKQLYTVCDAEFDDNTCIGLLTDFQIGLSDIPLEFRTEKVCLYALEKSSRNMPYVPEKFKNKQFYTKAYKNIDVIKMVPEDMISEEFWINIMSNIKILKYDDYYYFIQHDRFSEIFNIMPDKYKNYDMYMRAVRSYGYTLKYVPRKYRDYKMCHTAIISCSDAFNYIPKEYINEEIYIEISRHGINYMSYIPIEKFTQEMLLNILKHNNYAMHHYFTYNNNIANTGDIHFNILDKEKFMEILDEQLNSYYKIPHGPSKIRFDCDDNIINENYEHLLERRKSYIYDGIYIPLKYRTMQMLVL